MNRLIHLKKAAPLFVVACALACFGFLPQMQAVAPPPDGCYPNYTTAEGCNALQFLGAGVGNTGLGWYSLFSNTDASFSTGVGAGALALNNGDSNTAVGAAALLLNSTGFNNVAVGTNALVFNDTGDRNTANGAFALFNNTTGNSNTATGLQALEDNATGNQNTANGYRALARNTTGHNNTANGAAALAFNTSGTGNIALGVGAGNNITTADDVIAIGAQGADVSNSCYVGNIWNQPGGSQAVYVNSAGKLGTQVSSRRFKDEIRPMEQASEVIYGLQPVRFRYKQEIEPKRPLSFGLIAEEVEKICPDLVTRGGDGKVNAVRYDAVNAMLLNEFLKEHKTVEEQGAMIAQQQKQIEALTAGLRKVSAQLAVASLSGGGLEASKFATRRIRRGGPAPQVVNNP